VYFLSLFPFTPYAVSSSSFGVVPSTIVNIWNQFPDVVTHQYRDSISFLAQRGIVKGYPHGNFEPEWTVTRAEFMKMLWAGLSSTQWWASHNAALPEYAGWCFRDIGDTWYAPYVCQAKARGIVKWYPDGTFKPSQAVTFAEWMKMALEIFAIPVDTMHSAAHQRYQPYFSVMHHAGLFSQYSLMPDKLMSRGDVAYLVHRLILHKEQTRPFTYIRDARSIGCFQPHPRFTPRSVRVWWVDRPFFVDIGSNYTPWIPTRLLFAFHGRTNSSEAVRSYFDLYNHWDANHIIVYPSWIPVEWPTRSRSNPWDAPHALRDFALFDQLLKEISSLYCIDMDSIFAVWHSLWWWFTNNLGCFRGHVLRGIASVWWWPLWTQHWCTGPVASMIIHNPRDELAPIAGSQSVHTTFHTQNMCSKHTTRIGHPESNCEISLDCHHGLPVVWCPHSVDYEYFTGREAMYYPHTRPKFAGQEIQKFFQWLP
jgi:polyhydroxybutyrate depolymerase